MKNKLFHKRDGTDYSRLYRKLTLQLFIIVAVAVAVVTVVGMLARGWFGNQIAALFQNVFGVDSDTSVRIYHYVIRENLEIFYIIAIAVLVFVLSRYLFTRFSRYFGEINKGIDLLAGGAAGSDGTDGFDRGGAAVDGAGRTDPIGEIEFSPELEPMARKLNALRRTLERRELEAKLAEQRKNDVVMYLAHDLKTPLTSVIGYLSLLDEAPDMPAEQRAKYTGIAFDKACRLEQLIDEFFEITRYNLRTIALSKKEIDLSYMLMQMADEFYPQLAQGGSRAILHAEDGLTVYGDPDKLARVFNNILKNAAAYGEPGSAVEITARGDSGRVLISFRNAGSLAADKLAVIFEKFYRLDETRGAASGGAGLGLAIAKEIVTLHGGSIRAESEGGYTIFTVDLPAAESSPMKR